jgi:AraC family transcriptional regulator of adaptative response/methylated-DNA-[protein]-cysteine methyltransferase
MTDYQRIETAILYLKENFKDQPNLDEVAKRVHLSPFHFQRLFKEWAGVSPKKFVQFLSVEFAKELLKKNVPLADASFETGLSGTSRLHDLFISIEGMTPGDFKNGGKDMTIHYSFSQTVFGEVIIASTHRGICHLAFVTQKAQDMQILSALFPYATFVLKKDALQNNALKFFSHDWSDLQKIKLHLKGTPFQLKVWQSLLKIPFGDVRTYGTVAENIEHVRAVRAVGTAIGANPVAFLIPCHRVIRSTGVTGEYHWGAARKHAILGWEASRMCAS